MLQNCKHQPKEGHQTLCSPLFWDWWRFQAVPPPPATWRAGFAMLAVLSQQKLFLERWGWEKGREAEGKAGARGQCTRGRCACVLPLLGSICHPPQVVFFSICSSIPWESAAVPPADRLCLHARSESPSSVAPRRGSPCPCCWAQGSFQPSSPSASKHGESPLPAATESTWVTAAPTSPVAPSASRQLPGSSPRACAPEPGSTKSRCRHKDGHTACQQHPGRCSTACFPALVWTASPPWTKQAPTNLSREFRVLQWEQRGGWRPGLPSLRSQTSHW